MGDNYMNFFPADPRLPKPDWPRLRGQLLQCGFVKSPRQGGGIAYSVGGLWHDIGHDRGISNYHRQRMKDVAQLVAALKNATVVPQDFRIDAGAVTIPELATLLRQGGFVSPDFALSFSEEFDAGAAFEHFCEIDDSETNITPTISYQDDGNRIGVYLGPESLFEPPGIPGTDRAVEDWKELMDRWTKNPEEKWIDPETGQGYGILDLDWENTLGAGRCTLEVLQPGYLNPLKTTELLSDLTSIPFKFCWYHI
jgi:hypothetical protein